MIELFANIEKILYEKCTIHIVVSIKQYFYIKKSTELKKRLKVITIHFMTY